MHIYGIYTYICIYSPLDNIIISCYSLVQEPPLVHYQLETQNQKGHCGTQSIIWYQKPPLNSPVTSEGQVAFASSTTTSTHYVAMADPELTM